MDPAQFQQLSEEAIDALRCGDDVRAGAIADQLAAAEPDNPTVRVIRAQALLGTDSGDEALSEAGRAVQLQPDSVYARRLLGLAAWRVARLGLAQESFERAVELSGRQGDVLAEYAWFMAQERGPRLAVEAADEAVRANEHSSTAWAALGLAQFRLHQRDQAEASLRRALQLDPNDLYAQSAMAVLLHDRCKDPQAEALVDLLRDVPGTEELVEAVHREAKKRQIAKMLVERQADPDARRRPAVSRARGAWLLLTSVMITGLLLLFHPDEPVAILACVILPLLGAWYVLRFFD